MRMYERKICGTKYSRMDQVKFFKGCFPQILLGRFLNTVSHIFFKISLLRSCEAQQKITNIFLTLYSQRVLEFYFIV